MGAFRNLRIEPFDILGKMRHAQVVSTRADLVQKVFVLAQQRVGVANDIELLIYVRKPAGAVEMVFLAALNQERPWRDKRCNVAHVEQTPESRRVIAAAIAVEVQ